MAIDLATVGVKLEAKGMAQVKGAFGDVSKGASNLKKSLGDLLNPAKAITGALAGIGLVSIGRKFIESTIEAQKQQAQLAAAIKSTGGAAGKTQEDLNKTAAALQRVTTYGDEAINSAQALLLTFTRIRGDEFDKATKTILDMSTALGQDLKSSAIQVGKALNDPITGVTALQRVGVSFSQSQKDVIKQLVETGRQAEAQRLILKELETEFGGSAAAARNTLGGALQALSNAWGDLFEISTTDSEGIVGAINDITAALPDLKKAFDDAFGSAIDWTKDITLHLNIANQGLENLSHLLRITAAQKLGIAPSAKDLEALTLGIAKIKELRQEDEALERHHELRGNQVGFLGALDPLDAPRRNKHPALELNGEADAAKKASAELDKRIQLLTKSLPYDDLRAKSSKELATLEKTLEKQIAAGNLSLERRIDLETKLTAVEEARAEAERINKMLRKPAGPGEMIGITPTKTPDGADLFAGPMEMLPDSKIKTIQPRVPERLFGQIPTPEQFKIEAAEIMGQYAESMIKQMESMAVTIRQGIASTLGNAIEEGFIAAFSGKGLGGALEAFGKTLLAGVGSILSDLGKTWVEYGILMTTLGSALWNPFTSGPAAIAIGAALIALGGALGGIAHKGSAGGHGVAGGTFRGSGRGEQIVRLKFVDRPTGKMEAVRPITVNATIIGPNDPRAQRDITQLIKNADRRVA